MEDPSLQGHCCGYGIWGQSRTHWKPLAAEGEWRDEGLLRTGSPLQPDAPQTQDGSGGIKTNAEKAAAKEPPVVEGGRFAVFLFGEVD